MTRSVIAGALAAIAISALACVNTAPPGAPTAEEVLAAKTRGEMLRVITAEPLRCPASRDGWEICVWQLGDRNAAWYALAQTLGTHYRVNVICEFPSGGGARERDCLALPAASPPTQGKSPKRLHTSPAEAQAQLDAARTIWELSALVGDAPVRCSSVDERSRFCVWQATNRTKGFATLLPLLEKRARLQLSCTLPADGSQRAPGSCRAQPG
jgi:hypothetical protein